MFGEHTGVCNGFFTSWLEIRFWRETFFDPALMSSMIVLCLRRAMFISNGPVSYIFYTFRSRGDRNGVGY